jgi:hypothetical protein
MNLPSDQHLFSIKEAAEVLFGKPKDKWAQGSYKRTRRLVQLGFIKAMKDGTKTYIKRKDLAEFLGYDE